MFIFYHLIKKINKVPRTAPANSARTLLQ